MAPSIIHFSNVHVFDGTSFSTAQNVTLEDGLIKSISEHDAKPPANAECIEGDARYLIPGLIDCHVHIRNKDQLLTHAQHGLTTLLDMGCWPAALRDSFRGLTGRPSYFTAGLVGMPVESGSLPRPGIPKECLVSSKEDAIRFVNMAVEGKTEYVKIVADDKSDLHIVRLLADEAKKVDKLSVCHAPSVVTYQLAHEAGADVLTHAPMEGTLSESLAKQIHEAGQICVPTLVMMEACVKNGIRPGLDLRHSLESVRRMHIAGVPILTGTDSNSGGPGAPAEILHGSSFAGELSLLVDAGLTPLEVLHAATSGPAKHFRLEDRGLIEVGKRADLVLLDGNPLDDITAYQRPEEVFCGGVRVEKAYEHPR